MKIKFRAVEKKSPAKERRKEEKARIGSCHNPEEKKAVKKAELFNKKMSGGTAR